MKRTLKTVALILLLAVLILSHTSIVDGAVFISLDTPNNKLDIANDNLTFFFWFGPSQSPVYITPTFAWQNDKQPSVLYVVDILGLYEFSEENSTVKDSAFQRNETVSNGGFDWVGSTRWSSSNESRTVSGVTFAFVNLTLNGITTPRHQIFNYTTGNNLTLGATTYGIEAPNQRFYSYSYAADQPRTDLFFNLTQWRWTSNSTNNNLALMLGFYALNVTVIQGLGIPLEDYVVEDYNFLSPEGLKDKYLPFDPSAFLLTAMNLTASNGATTAGGAFSLTRNETRLLLPIYERKLGYTLPQNSSADLPFIKLQFASGNTTLPGYFSFPGFAVGLDSNGQKKDTLNVAASYISTGNYLRLFLSYPYFSSDQLRHFFSFGVDDTFLPPQPTPPGVYIVLPSISLSEAAIIAGIAVISVIAAVFSTRMIRRASPKMRK